MSTLVSFSPLSMDCDEGGDATPTHFRLRSGPQRPGLPL